MFNQIYMCISYRNPVPVAPATAATAADTIAEKEYEGDNTLGNLDDINASIVSVELLSEHLGDQLSKALDLLKHAKEKQLDHLKTIDLSKNRLKGVAEAIWSDLITALRQLLEIQKTIEANDGDIKIQIQTRRPVYMMAHQNLLFTHHNSQVLYTVLAHKSHGVNAKNVSSLKKVAELTDAFNVLDAIKKDNGNELNDNRKAALLESIQKAHEFLTLMSAIKEELL